jgi:photosystem II stability/assembly factor-like uncharacterized protein
MGLKDVRASALTIDQSNSSTIFAGLGNGVYKSTNGGADWQPSKTRLSANLSSIVIDPSHTNVLYLGSLEGWVFVSADGGESWTAVSEGLPGPGKATIGIAPSGTLFTGTYGAGVFKRQLTVTDR